MTIVTERLAKLDTLDLLDGGHKTPDDGMCAMEAVAWLAGEPHSDAPSCTCPLITRAVQKLNDRMPHDLRNELLKPLLPRIIGTRAGRDVMVKRGFIAADMAVRVFAPMAMKARGRLDLAKSLRECLPIVDRETVEAGRKAAAAADAAAAAAAAADDAADAAYAAAAAAAAAAADADAADAAYAAAAAAAAAAADAADAYAYAAVRRPAWLEAVRMVERMIECVA